MEPFMTAVRVKICGITRGADLHAAVAAGADALGFVFTDRSKRVLKVAQAAGLVAEVPAFVSRVALFMNQDPKWVADVLDRVPVNLLQFHGDEDADYCRQFGLPYIKAVSMSSARVLAQAQNDYRDAAALLLDSHAPGGVGGTGQQFDWSMVPQASMPLVLAGGLDPGNVRQAVVRVKPWAVDVSSGVEDAPGIKNPVKMRDFIKEAKREY
jgi:phosphoribosylanthranilate isomerase